MFGRKCNYVFLFLAVSAFIMAGCGRKETKKDSVGIAADISESENMTMESEPAMFGTGDVTGDKRQGQDNRLEVFAEKVQETVSDRDMEGLADMLIYPCVFISEDQETIIFNNRDDFMKQNPDMIFGDDLMISVANVDTATLTMNAEGVILGEGTSNITLQEKSDGSIGIREVKE